MKKIEEEGARTLNPEDPSRRKLVKALVGGVTVLAAYHTLPTDWSKPLISQISLPAHAATSGTDPEPEPDTPEPVIVTYNIELRGISVSCSGEPPEELATVTQVNGIVEASDGSSMAGVVIAVEIGSVNDNVIVLAGNTFQWNGIGPPEAPPVTVRVSFSDTSTYGSTYSDTDVGCGEPPGPPPPEP